MNKYEVTSLNFSYGQTPVIQDLDFALRAGSG